MPGEWILCHGEPGHGSSEIPSGGVQEHQDEAGLWSWPSYEGGQDPYDSETCQWHFRLILWSSQCPLSPTSMKYTTRKKTTNSCLLRPVYLVEYRLTIAGWSHIFLQLCTGGDLFTYIHHTAGTGNQICEAEAKYIMYQLLQGLKYLHEKMISHRGLFLCLHTPFSL